MADDLGRRLSDGLHSHESLMRRRERPPRRLFEETATEVFDTAELCLAWLVDWKLESTAAGVVALPDLVLQPTGSPE